MPADIQIIAEKAPDYRVISVDGAYTWLSPQAGSIDFSVTSSSRRSITRGISVSRR